MKQLIKPLCLPGLALMSSLGFVVAIALFAQTKKSSVVTIRLDSLTGLEVVDGKAEIATYRGRRALHLSPLPNHQAADYSMLAIVTATDFKDGTIEVEVAGAPPRGRPGRFAGVHRHPVPSTGSWCAGRKSLSAAYERARR
jgi:hypothetical protein